MLEQIIAAFSALPQVEAIALGGSRAGTHFDEKSDYDIYLYCTDTVCEVVRRRIYEPLCSYAEIGNRFWETEDNGTFVSGIDFDILFRDLDAFSAGIANVAEKHIPSNAYTTCMWHNLLTCQILYDRSGRLTAAKTRFDVPYPEQLRQAILQRGRRLLYDSMPAYSLQIEKAAARRDLVSINHRTAAFLETYFDILFALNRRTHPGEKRLVQLCGQMCPILPEAFEENLNRLFAHMFTEPEALVDDLKRIVDALAKIL
ncbi:MAG: DUF4037 domain-containing protein [Oscillospiraceae bacterium]|nr:DUF4037 domain-containing protein [Oscillospiraceae bacterium]